MLLVLFIICEIIGFIAVDFAYRLYMTITGVDAMYINGKKKIIHSFIAGGVICMLILRLFGIS